jgi:transcription elongation GreA/GreB family factor
MFGVTPRRRDHGTAMAKKLGVDHRRPGGVPPSSAYAYQRSVSLPLAIWSTDWFRTPRQETEKLISFLEDTRKTWRPEHSKGESWIEEGLAIVSETTRRATTTAQVVAEADRQLVLDSLLKTEDYFEIEVGDLVRYVDVLKPQDVLSVRITNRASDLANGLISEVTPLAQALLGALTGDEVPLHVPGAARKLLRIMAVNKVESSVPA